MMDATTNAASMSTTFEEQAGIDDALANIKTYSLSARAQAPNGEKVISTTWNMFDFFSKYFLQIIISLGGKQLPDMIKFYQCFQKFKDIVYNKFCTSSEEKGTIDSYHNKIFQREEKAIKDFAALEQQLQYERDERDKAFSRYQMAEQHLHQEEEFVREIAMEAEQQIEMEFNVLEEHQSKAFQAEESDFFARCTELRTVLNHLQVENREAELSLRGKKEQSAEEVNNLLREYNEDIQLRRDELHRMHEDHKKTEAKLQVYQIYFRNKELQEARRQEEERLRNEAIQARLMKKEDAVVFIQFAWCRHRRRKRAKEALEKKDIGKQDKTKSKKGASSKTAKKKSKGSKSQKNKPKK